MAQGKILVRNYSVEGLPNTLSILSSLTPEEQQQLKPAQNKPEQ
jgi:hypothetical protein